MMRWVLILLFGLVGISSAAASPDCMTLREARQTSNKHLYWHPSESGAHCWGELHGKRYASKHRKIRSSGGRGESRPVVLNVDSGRALGTLAADRPKAGVAPSPPEESQKFVVLETETIDLAKRWPDTIEAERGLVLQGPVSLEQWIRALPPKVNSPPDHTPSMWWLAILAAVVVVTAADTLWGNRIFNRLHTKAIRDGYYT